MRLHDPRHWTVHARGPSLVDDSLSRHQCHRIPNPCCRIHQKMDSFWLVWRNVRHVLLVVPIEAILGIVYLTFRTRKWQFVHWRYKVGGSSIALSWRRKLV